MWLHIIFLHRDIQVFKFIHSQKNINYSLIKLNAFLCSWVLLCAIYIIAQSCLTLWEHTDCSLPGSSVSGDSAGKNTGVCCHALLQGIFPTQGSNTGLLHCRWNLYHLSHQGKAKYRSFLFLSVGTFIQFRYIASDFPILLSQNSTLKIANEQFNFRNIMYVIYTVFIIFSISHNKLSYPVDRKSKVIFKSDVKLMHHLKQRLMETRKLKILLSPAMMFSISSHEKNDKSWSLPV